MKKHYKTKKVNITKLKSYLKDAITTTDKGSSKCSRVKRNNTKHNDLH